MNEPSSELVDPFSASPTALPSFLLIRPTNHLIVGVSWGRRDARRGFDGSRGTVDSGWLTLTLPPQHVAEETSPGAVAAAVLSGPSRLTVAGVAGAPGADVSSILDMFMDGAPAPPGTGSTGRTRIEMPWHLVIEPRTADGGGARFVPDVQHRPGFPGATCRLWTLRLSSEDEAAGLIAVEALASADDDPFSLPLANIWRQRLVAETALRPAVAQRMLLSGLGGTLSATGSWGGLSWTQDSVLGRDVHVEIVAEGVLYPTGHRATYQRTVSRTFDSGSGAAALGEHDVLIIASRDGTLPVDAARRRAFPFERLEILEQTVLIRPPQWQSDAAAPGTETFFPVVRRDGSTGIPIRLFGRHGNIESQIPLIFVAGDALPPPGIPPGSIDERHDNSPLAEALTAAYGSAKVAGGGIPVDLVRSERPVAGDIYEVQSISLGGAWDPAGVVPQLTALEVTLPEARSLVGDAASYSVRFSDTYLTDGVASPTLLSITGAALELDFTGRSDRSGGLVAPAYVADALSRTAGPVVEHALAGVMGELPMVSTSGFFSPTATILGFPIRSLIGAVTEPPTVMSQLSGVGAPTVTMAWTGIRLKSFGTFRSDGDTRLDLRVRVGPGGQPDQASTTDTACTISNFSLVLPPAKPLISIHFDQLTFRQHGGAPPTVQVAGVAVAFLAELKLLADLGSVLDFGGHGPDIDVSTAGIVAGYALPLPSVTAGVFVCSNIAVSAWLSIPFDRRPMTLSLGFASPANRFALTVLMLGGGGYLEIELTRSGLRRLDLALEFGALLAMNFVVASAEVHALGGIHFRLVGDQVEVTGYLRIGGCIDILGLVSVSLELCVGLSYRTATNALVGRATIVIDIDLFLWSDSIELDSGEWILTGGGQAGDAPASSTFAAIADRGTQFDDYWYAFDGARHE